MATTLTTTSTGTVTVLFAMRYGYEREQRTIIHDIIGTQYPAVTLKPAASRSGVLTLLCDSIDNARDVEAVLSAGEVVDFYASYPDADPETFSFVPAGTLKIFENEGLRTWTVSTNFREVES